ncbi:phosphoribosyltransferase-like protein [Microbacterium maritypicum]
MSLSEADVGFILDTRDFFSNAAIWPQQPREIDHQGWLENFSDSHDRSIAANLLDSYLLISSAQTEKMLISAFHSLAPLQGDMFCSDPSTYQQDWDAFRSSIAVTFPSRRNDPAGSGHMFVRTARTFVLDRATQLFAPEDLVASLASSAVPRPVVFVDDFSGSGDQFVATWRRNYTLPDDSTHTFASLAAAGLISQVFFIPSIATASAKTTLRTMAPEVCLLPAHLLPTRYSATSPVTSLVSPELRDDLHDFLVRHADRAGYSASHVYGYKDGGLALSFEHGTPDNTLPIFNGGTNRPSSWRPLRSK